MSKKKKVKDILSHLETEKMFNEFLEEAESIVKKIESSDSSKRLFQFLEELKKEMIKNKMRVKK